MSNTNEKIRSLRRQNGLSQDDLAKEMGVTRQTVSRWEIGTVQPSEENLKRLVLIFNVSDDYFTSDEEIIASVEEPEVNRLSAADQVQLFFAQRNNRTALIFAIVVTVIFCLSAVITWIISELCFIYDDAPVVVSSTNIDISAFIACATITCALLILMSFLWTVFALGRKRLQEFYIRNGGKPADIEFDEEEVVEHPPVSHRIIGRARLEAARSSEKTEKRQQSSTTTPPVRGKFTPTNLTKLSPSTKTKAKTKNKKK